MQQASRWTSPSLMPEIRWDGSQCRNSVAWTKVLLMHLWDVSNHSRHLTQVTDIAQDSWEIHILIVSDIRQNTGHCTWISLSTGAHLTYGSYFVTLYTENSIEMAIWRLTALLRTLKSKNIKQKMLTVVTITSAKQHKDF